MTSKKKHLIIGCGPAALSAVDAIRRLTKDDEIKVISREDRLPYSPAVLPYVLGGRTTEGDLFAGNADYFSNREVEFVRGQEAVRVLPEKRQVVFRNGKTERYDNLLVACGARSVSQPVQGSADGDVPGFHTYDDYRQLRDGIKDGCDVTVLGAGMVAVELAVALVEKGCKVRIVGRSRPLRAYFNEEAGGYIRQTLADRGMEIRTGKNVSSVKKSHHGFELSCADGEVLSAGIVISCLGVMPNLAPVEGTGISTHVGILVNRQMSSNIQAIYAAGDVAEAPSFLDGSPGVCPILPEAIAQGKVAGANMAGKETFYGGWVPMNLLKFFGHSAFSIGATMPEPGSGEALENKNEGRRCYQRLVLRDGKLSGAMFVNVDIDPGVIQYLVRKQVSIDAHKRDLMERPAEVSRWLMMRAERGLRSD